MHQVENDESIVSEPYHLDRAGTLMRADKACTAAGAGLTVVAGRTRLGAGYGEVNARGARSRDAVVAATS